MADMILHGTLVDDGGETCACGFEWGQTTALGNITGVQNKVSGETFEQTITGLLGGITYYFRAFATNSAGTTYGAILSFVTMGGGATVSVLPATNIAENHATLNGHMTDSLNHFGEVRFQYGTTPAYGMNTPWQDGFFTGDDFYANIVGIAEGSVYHFRAQFRGSPIVSSGDMTFSTLSSLGPVTMVTEEIMQLLEG